MTSRTDRYARVAPVYETLAWVWSLGAIRRSKVVALEDLRPGSSVLVVGGGAGEDLAVALARSDRVTVVDRSRAMLDRCAERVMGRHGSLDVDLIHGDVDVVRGSWDCATLFFVLNVYGDGDAGRLLERVARRVRPGGTIRVADFDPTLGSWQKLHHAIPLAVFRRLTRNADSPIHDVPALADRHGLTVVRSCRVPVLRGLPIGYRSWVLSRIEE